MRSPLRKIKLENPSGNENIVSALQYLYPNYLTSAAVAAAGVE